MALSNVEGRRCLPAGGGQALAPPCGVLLYTSQSSLLGA